MRLDVELYPPELRRRFVPFGLSTLAGLLVAMVLILALLWQQLDARLAETRERLQGVEARAAELQAEIETLRGRTADDDRVARLEAAIARARTGIDQRRDLLAHLDRGARMGRFQPGPYLEGLARQVQEPLWLNTIRVGAEARTIAIEGHTLEPSALPRLITDLEAEPVFRGRQFRQLRMQRNEERPGWVDFHLTTEPAGEDADG